MSLKINHISPFVIEELDVALPDWKNLVPEDKAERLDEETLIQLLKDRKRAETYRIIADKRNLMFREMYSSEDKSVLDLVKEFGIFSYEQTSKWWEIEGKLNFIILQFRAKKKTRDIKNLRPSLDFVSQKINESIDERAEEENLSLRSSVNNLINGISGGDDSITKELNELFEPQVRNFQQDNKEIFNDYKNFVGQSVNGLIQEKISKIESGELSIDGLQRSDLFTDEEVVNLETKRDQMFEKIVDRRRKLNENAFEEVVSKNGFSKDSFLEKINKAPEDLVSNEAKQVVREVVSSAFILSFIADSAYQISKGETAADKARTAVSKFKYITDILSITSSSLKRASKKKKKTQSRVTDSPIFKWCNDEWGLFKHVATLGFCSGNAAATIVIDAVTSESFEWDDLEWNAISNILGFILFLLDSSKIASLIFSFLSNKGSEILKLIANKMVSLFVPYACDAMKNLKQEWENAIEFICFILCSLNAIFLSKNKFRGPIDCALESSKKPVASLLTGN